MLMVGTTDKRKIYLGNKNAANNSLSCLFAALHEN